MKGNRIKLISRPIGNWDPFQTSSRCIICWKPVKDNDPLMECPHCHSRAHQEHMLRWLAKKNHCPYCNKKW